MKERYQLRVRLAAIWFILRYKSADPAYWLIRSAEEQKAGAEMDKDNRWYIEYMRTKGQQRANAEGVRAHNDIIKGDNTIGGKDGF